MDPKLEKVPPEPDKGYGKSHGYGPPHGGPTGPGDAPAKIENYPPLPSTPPEPEEEDS